MIHLSCVAHSQHFKFINTLRIACTKTQVCLHGYEDVHTHANSSPLIWPPPSHTILFPVSKLSSITGLASVPTLPVVLYLLLTISRVPPNTALEGVCLHDICTLKGTYACVRCSVCVGASVHCTASWLHKLTGRCNLRVSHMYTHSQTHAHSKAEELAVFSSSHCCESDPWDTEKPQCQVCRFSLPPRKAETIQIQRAADGRGGHREQGVGVQSVLHTHQHTADTHRHTAGHHRESIERAKEDACSSPQNSVEYTNKTAAQGDCGATRPVKWQKFLCN